MITILATVAVVPDQEEHFEALWRLVEPHRI
jgi:hypothetical protein